MAWTPVVYSKRTINMFRDIEVPKKPGIDRELTLYNKLFRSTEDEGSNGFFNLLKQFEDVNWTPYEELPLIFSPLIYRNIERVKALIRRGYDVDAEAWDGTVILQKFNVPLDVFKLIIQSGANVNHKYAGNGTLLLDHVTAGYNSNISERVKILIENGADIQPLYDNIYEKMTCMRFKGDDHTFTIARHLLDNGFPVDLEKTLLYKAAHDNPSIKKDESVKELKSIIADYEDKAYAERKEIEDAISVDSDLAFAISKALSKFTPYNLRA